MESTATESATTVAESAVTTVESASLDDVHAVKTRTARTERNLNITTPIDCCTTVPKVGLEPTLPRF